MFSPFQTALGRANPDACFEQMTGIGTVYFNRRDLALQMIQIAGGGTLLVWQFQDAAWPPSWSMIRQGNNLYFWIAGTVNWQQWLGNVVGVFANTNGSYGNRVHSFFSGSALNLQAIINQNLPADWMDCNAFFAGHSYGAAVAFLLAVMWKNAVLSARVEFMGFACPKSMSGGFSGTLPNVTLIINHESDVVPYVPTNHLISVAPGAAPAWVLGIPVDWTTYGDTWTVTVRAELVQTPRTTFDGIPTPSLVSGTVLYHPSQAYVQSIMQMWMAGVGAGQNLPLVPIANTLLILGPAQTLDVNIDSNAFINVPQQNAEIFLNQAGGPLNPGNLNEVENFNGQLERVLAGNQILPAFSFLGGSNVAYKVLFSFTDGPKAGISESWVIDALPAGKSFPQFVADYLNVRMALSGAQTVFEFARFSSIPADLNPTLIYPTDLAPGTKTSGSFGLQPLLEESDVGTTCLLCAKKTLTKTARMYLRGIPDSIVIKGGQVKNDATFRDAFNAFRTYIGANGLGFRGADPAAKKKVKITAVAPVLPGNTVAFTVDQAVFPLPGPDGLAKHLNVRISGLTYNPNLNGPMTVVVDTATTCHSLRPIAMTAYIAPSAPFMIVNFAKTFQPVFLAIEKVGERKAGRPFGTSVGRAKNRVRG
jgi:hypothetical protein